MVMDRADTERNNVYYSAKFKEIRYCPMCHKKCNHSIRQVAIHGRQTCSNCGETVDEDWADIPGYFK